MVGCRFFTGDGEAARNLTTQMILHIEAGALDDSLVTVTGGVGVLVARVTGSEDLVISCDHATEKAFVEVNTDAPVKEVGGTLSGIHSWFPDTLYYVSEDLTIPAGSELYIQAGTRIMAGNLVNFHVEGIIGCFGSAEMPVYFFNSDSQSGWGGIRLTGSQDTVYFDYTLFSGGGNDPDFVFGHSDSQPVVYSEGRAWTAVHCWWASNPGKAAGALLSAVSLNQCVFSRCDTGGEYHNSTLHASDSHFSEIPGPEGTLPDDDNDGIYLAGVRQSDDTVSTIRNCWFYLGQDDAIDHNGALVDISGCTIRQFQHEGIAASNSHTIRVSNTLIRDCEQGIEAGYGAPQVFVDHCTVVNCEIGLRFGDSYNWGCNGTLHAKNSVIYFNSDNVLNYDNLSQGPVPGAIQLSYSLLTDPDYENGTGCITATPLFDEEYYLAPGSSGKGMALDGQDMGILKVWMGYTEQPKRINGNFAVLKWLPVCNRIEINFLKPLRATVTVLAVGPMGRILNSLQIDGSMQGNNHYLNLPDGYSGRISVSVISPEWGILTESFLKWQ
ncbi:MAG: hypothetical protein Kow00127_21590 [Bacteroidales bacterium]